MNRSPKQIALAVALLLPFMMLALSWGMTHRLAQQGQEWLIPIRGYDPRDLLRGHYVQYQYDWPIDASSSGEGTVDLSSADRLCIEGAAPRIDRVRPLTTGMNDCAVIAQATLGARREVQGVNSGIFFASQDRAVALSRQLADPRLRGFVRVRIGQDGAVRPVDLEFSRRDE